jgi:hypothetical protein
MDRDLDRRKCERTRTFRATSSEIRQFRSRRMENPGGDASHLRGPCRQGHSITLENTVHIGKAGWRCRACRRRVARESLHRSMNAALTRAFPLPDDSTFSGLLSAIDEADQE